MITDVYTAQQKNRLLIAYQNTKNQNVFLQVLQATYAPQLAGVLICDASNDIPTVISNCFEFKKFKKSAMEIGVKKRHIWKPLLANLEKELDFTTASLCRAKRDLGILIQKLQDILLYVEPDKNGLKTYIKVPVINTIIKHKMNLVFNFKDLSPYFILYFNT